MIASSDENATARYRSALPISVLRASWQPYPAGYFSWTATLFCCLPTLTWTAKALAAERGVGALGELDLRGALRLIDRSLGQLATSKLPRKQAQACEFVFIETDLVTCATNDLRVS